MARRTTHEALQAYVSVLQRALSCVTNAVLARASYDPGSDYHVFVLNQNSPVTLSGTGGILLEAREVAQLVPVADLNDRWITRSAGYAFALSDRQGAEILAYHWHPMGRSHVTEPHLHLGPAAHVGNRPTADAHLPTGMVYLEDVIRLVIEAYGVSPRRPDWEATLRATRAEGEELTRR